MSTSLAGKLQLKAAQRLRVLNAPQGYVERLEQELPGITVSRKGDTDAERLAASGSGSTDAVLLFVNSLAEAQRLAPTAIGAVEANGRLWMAYPKGTSKVKTDVNRDRLWEAIKPLGWLATRQIALDDIWSAMRFRPAELVGK
jgi:hypothetical protein